MLMFGLWLAFFFVIHTYVGTLNKIVVPVLELPLGFCLPVQAAIVVFLVTLVWFARATPRQSMIPKSGYRFSEKIMLHQESRAR
jgi:hypothetical protein